jgi:hypothetical protein
MRWAGLEPYHLPHNGSPLSHSSIFVEEEGRTTGTRKIEWKEEEGRIKKERKKQAHPCILC